VALAVLISFGLVPFVGKASGADVGDVDLTLLAQRQQLTIDKGQSIADTFSVKLTNPAHSELTGAYVIFSFALPGGAAFATETPYSWASIPSTEQRPSGPCTSTPNAFNTVSCALSPLARGAAIRVSSSLFIDPVLAGLGRPKFLVVTAEVEQFTPTGAVAAVLAEETNRVQLRW
jgi:hypothetical protein